MSQYISSQEAADKWDLSRRRISVLCAQGRIPGATIVGRTWMIPADAEKPTDPRCSALPPPPPESLSRELEEAHDTLSRVYLPADNPDAALDMVGDEGSKVYLETILAYLRGDFEGVKDIYNGIEARKVVKLMISGTAIAAAISLGDYPFFLEVETWLKSLVQTGISAGVTAYVEFALSIAYIGLAVDGMVPDWLKNGDFKALPDSAKPYAAYLRTQYLSHQKNPKHMLAVAQAYLSLCASERAIYDPDTYLRIYCAEACWELGYEAEAKDYLRGAMKKNLPHGFISPFAENVPKLHGLCEQLLKQEFPAHYSAVLGQCERVARNWGIFHNRFTRDNIAIMLPIREYQIARLVSQGVPYKKIAEQFGLSAGSVTNIMQKTYETLFISGPNRKQELAKYIL